MLRILHSAILLSQTSKLNYQHLGIKEKKLNRSLNLRQLHFPTEFIPSSNWILLGQVSNKNDSLIMIIIKNAHFLPQKGEGPVPGIHCRQGVAAAAVLLPPTVLLTQCTPLAMKPQEFTPTLHAGAKLRPPSHCWKWEQNTPRGTALSPSIYIGSCLPPWLICNINLQKTASTALHSTEWQWERST